MQDLYWAVRNTGAQNLIFVSGMNWGADLTPVLSAPLDGYGIVYAAHIYCSGCEGALPVGIDQETLPVSARYPVAVTEFGQQDPTQGFNARVIDFAEANGLGWMAYVWAGCDPKEFCLLESWDTYLPNVAGQPVYSTLKAKTG
jgi:hypothetical protein